jgi:hypothetical protein
MGTKSSQVISTDSANSAVVLDGKRTNANPLTRPKASADGTSESPTRVSCRQTTIREPQPFLGTANEILIFADGTVWKDVSYKYLYLYAYSPAVTLCPAEGRMILDEHVFTLVQIR